MALLLPLSHWFFGGGALVFLSHPPTSGILSLRWRELPGAEVLVPKLAGLGMAAERQACSRGSGENWDSKGAVF